MVWQVFLGGHLAHFWTNLGLFRDHFRTILGLFWDNFGTILGLFWDHSGTILGLFWDHFGTILGRFWDDFGPILGRFWVHVWLIFGSFWLRLGCFWLLSCIELPYKHVHRHVRRFIHARAHTCPQITYMSCNANALPVPCFGRYSIAQQPLLL